MSRSRTSFPGLARASSRQPAVLGQIQAGAMPGLRDSSTIAPEAGAVAARTKGLMARALGIAARRDECLAFHGRAPVAMRAAPAQFEETIAVAASMDAGPSLRCGVGALNGRARRRRPVHFPH